MVAFASNKSVVAVVYGNLDKPQGVCFVRAENSAEAVKYVHDRNLLPEQPVIVGMGFDLGKDSPIDNADLDRPVGLREAAAVVEKAIRRLTAQLA